MDMASFAGTIVAFIIVVCIGCFVSLKGDLNREKIENDKLRAQNAVLISLLKEAQEREGNSVIHSSKDVYNLNKKSILDAVKYARKASHPDNGGVAADFNKYNELYNKLRSCD